MFRLSAAGAVLALLVLPGALTAAPDAVSEDASRWVYYYRNAGDTFLVEPIQGALPVEDFYAYDEVDASPHSGLEVADTSQVFLYDGPDGVSLVFLHDTTDWTAGAVDMRFSGLPDAGRWAVMDDFDCCPTDRDFDSDRASVVTWGWGTCCADGGAFRGGLEAEFEVRVTAAWDEAASKWRGPAVPSTATAWSFVTGTQANPERTGLDKGSPLVVGRALLTQVDHRGSLGIDACASVLCNDDHEDPAIGPIRTGDRAGVITAPERVAYVRVAAVWDASSFLDERMRLYAECATCADAPALMVEGTSPLYLKAFVPESWQTQDVRFFLRGAENLPADGRAELDQEFRISGYMLS